MISGKPRCAAERLRPDWAQPYFGAPFRQHGRGPDAYDCWGLVEAIYRDIGIHLPDYRGGVSDVHDFRQVGPVMDRYRQDFAKVDRPQMRDIVLLRTGRLPAHVGLYVAPSIMFHVEEGTSACFERFDGLAWGKRLLGFYRWTP